MAGVLRGSVVRTLARAATFGWFRSVDRSGLGDVPDERPLLVIANHDGGFVDPALLAATFPRYPRFLAMASLWRTAARPFLSIAGAIPVYSAADGPTSANVETFSRCHEVLAGDGVIGIFPEGRANDEPHLLPVKTGAARIALGSRRIGADGLLVYPVGLIYEDKSKARARAYVRAGAPLDLDAWVHDRAGGHPLDEYDHASVDALTEEMRARLAAVALDFDSTAELVALTEAAEIVLRPLRTDPGWQPSMDSREDLAAALAAAPDHLVGQIGRAVADYQGALEANAVTDEAVAADPRAHRRVHVAGLLAFVAILPLAVAGAVVNGVPGILTTLSGRRRMAPVTRATVKFLVALVVFPLTWVVWRYTAVADEPHPWLTMVFLGPICGLALSWALDRLARARRARVDLRELAGVGTSLDGLRARRASVVEAARVALDAPAGSLGD